MANDLTPEQSPSMNPALRDFWLTQSMYKVLYGGRSSSKSWDAAANVARVTQMVKVRVLCTRMFQNRIEESVYNLIKKQIERFGLSKRFSILKNKIISDIGSEVIFYGIARNIEEIKSLEGIDILWIEEAHALTAEMWEILEPTIFRNEGAEIWVIFNPRLATDFAYKKFVLDPPKNCIVRKINYDENPFLSQSMRMAIEALKEKDYDEYMHVYEGVPRSDDNNAIIKREWIMASIDAHKKLGIVPSGLRRIGYDIADDGSDYNATTEAHGLLTVKVEQWKGKEDGLMDSCKRVYHDAKKTKARIYYDNIGVGAFVGSKIKELNQTSDIKIRYDGFGAGNSVIKPDDIYQHGVKNRDFFCNLKAQAWWLVADRFRNTYNAVHHGEEYKEDELISISSSVNNLDKLIDELSTPLKDFDQNGKVKVQGKKELEYSPNLADSFIIAYSPLVGKYINYGDLL